MNLQETRIIFMGSPEIAVPVLNRMIAAANVVGVVTQPDRPAGRGKKIVAPAVKLAAEAAGIPLIQPPKLNDLNVFEQLQRWQPDAIVVMAYGKILRRNVLELPRLGCINVHASILPRWRGAAPIQAAILAGDTETGISIMQMDAGMDTGAVYDITRCPIAPDDTAATLSEKLAILGADALSAALPRILADELRALPQPEDGITYAATLKKEDGLMDFSESAAALERKVRAYNPWPSAFFLLDDQPLKVHEAHVVGNSEKLAPGTRTFATGLPAIAAADGLLALDAVQAPGKNRMPGKAFLAGFRGWKEEG